MLHSSFQDDYLKYGDEWLHSEQFIVHYQISTVQAFMDREHLFGALQQSLDTDTKSDEYLSEFDHDKDGICVWINWVKEYGSKASTSIKIDEVEHNLRQPYACDGIHQQVCSKVS